MSARIGLAFLGVDHPHGAGWRELLRHFDDELAITALVPELAGGLTSLEERHADVPRFATVDELIADGEFDAAVICLPNDRAPAAAAKLARAGKHILLEKPGAATAADFQVVADAVAEAGVVFQNGYLWRYDELANRLRRMVADGQFGKLISVEMTYATVDVVRRDPGHYLFDRQVSGGGFFNWLACHYLDLLLYITDQQIIGTTARVGVFGEEPCAVDDGGTAILELSGGGLATLTGGYWIPRWTGETAWTLRGSRRWVRWSLGPPDCGGRLEIHGPKPHWEAMEDRVELPIDRTSGYGGGKGVALVRDWLDTIAAGTNACRNSIASSQQTLAVLDAIYASSEQGRRLACQIGPAAI